MKKHNKRKKKKNREWKITQKENEKKKKRMEKENRKWKEEKKAMIKRKEREIGKVRNFCHSTSIPVS